MEAEPISGVMPNQTTSTNLSTVAVRHGQGPPRQLTLALQHLEAFGAEDFFVSASNGSAVDLIDSWPDWSHPAAVIVGPIGSGKSHLANVWRARSQARMLSAQHLTEADIPRLNAEHAVVVEDLDAGVSDQRALFHILNLAREAKFSVLFTSRQAPGELEVALPDLRSRLRALPVITIDMPDQGLLRAVLIKLLADRQIHVEPHIINFAVTRMERSMEAARHLVDAIDQIALAEKRPITRAVVTEALRRLYETDD